MTVRILVLSALALVFLAAGLAALWSGAVLLLEIQDPFSGPPDDMEEVARQQAWLNMLLSAAGPSVGAGLIAGVGALALAVRARQVAGTRTTRAPASTSARNPTTTPNSSPSSSNSSARSNVTSNLDAFR